MRYDSATIVDAPAAEVFRYVSRPENMPEYLDTVSRAEAQGPDRVRIEGGVDGHRYANDGWFNRDEERLRMEWGSDGENVYSGYLEVEERGEGSCEVRVHLDFAPKEEQAERFREQAGSRDALIQSRLDSALQSIKDMVEREGVPEPNANRPYMG
jgi:uncharacterized protein YndB with AHSA1/START domain